MTKELKRWVAVMFPNGPFKGTVNLAIKGEHVVTAQTAKDMIDAAEANANVGTNGSGSTSPQGETKV